MYNTGFEAIHRKLSETGELADKLNYLFYPEDYYSVYEGDDENKRFPGVTWICNNPKCRDNLNDQVGFDDYLPYWQCRKCGYINPIDVQEIYENEEDYRNGIPVDPEDFIKALDGR